MNPFQIPPPPAATSWRVGSAEVPDNHKLPITAWSFWRPAPILSLSGVTEGHPSRTEDTPATQEIGRGSGALHPGIPVKDQS